METDWRFMVLIFLQFGSTEQVMFVYFTDFSSFITMLLQWPDSFDVSWFAQVEKIIGDFGKNFLIDCIALKQLNFLLFFL